MVSMWVCGCLYVCVRLGAKTVSAPRGAARAGAAATRRVTAKNTAPL